MKHFVFSQRELFSQHLCGKFQTTNEDWVHLTRNLTDFELMVVTEGTLYIGDDKTKYTISQSEYLLMPPTPYQHGYQKGSCSFYWLHFGSGADFTTLTHEDITYEPGSIYVPQTGKLQSMDRVIILMKQLQDSDKRYHNPLLNDSLATAILSEIACQSSLYRKHSQSHQTSQLFNDIADFIRYHCCENITVAQIGEYFNYNPKYLTSLFKKQCGMNIKQYILNEKMDIAKAELSDTNHSISQIAYHVGFSDAHNFTNAFRKLTGLSPSEYRQSYGKRSLFYN